MLRLSRSFIVSLLVHIVLLGTLFYSYEYISSHLIEKQKDEMRCVKLSSLRDSSIVKQVRHEKKKIETPKKQKVIEKQKKALQEKPLKKKKTTPVKDTLVTQSSQLSSTETTEQAPSKTSEKNEELEQSISEEEETAPSLETETNQEKQKNPETVYIDENIERIVELLQENLYYPRSARRRHLEGEVLIHFKLTKEAEVLDVRVVASRYEILSRGAIETIESLSREFPKPKESLELTVPINYSLKK